VNARIWSVVAVGGLVFMSNYIDKAVIGVVGPTLLKTTAITKFQLGVIFTIFGLAYTFAQPFLATLADRSGPRRVVGALVAIYGLFTAITGFVTASFGVLLAARLVTGAGESASMPAVTGGLRTWVPRDMRASVQGILHACTRVGAGITVPVTILMLTLYGIRGPFVLFGIGTLLVGALWFVVFRDTPDGSPRKPALARNAWNAVLHSKSMWALSLADFCYFYTLTIYLTWLPTFLVSERHFTLINVGIYGALPFIGGGLGGIVGGWLSDTLGKRTGNMRLWRRVVPCVGMLGSVCLSLPAAFASNQTTTIVLFTASFFMLDAAVSVFWAIAMDIGGDYASTSAGWMNTWANVGGIVSPLVFGTLVQLAHSWTLPFVVASIIMVIGAALVWAIDPDERLSAPDERHESRSHANLHPAESV
jgi:ACS family D-galactonate transporter-like MFS transporter